MALIQVPQNWPNPRFDFGNRVQVKYPALPESSSFCGIIIGMRYHGYESMRRPLGWEYDILKHPSDTRIPPIEPTAEDWLTLLPEQQ